ncbi:hypothetical protein [Streptomyces sp. NPDC054783]
MQGRERRGGRGTLGRGLRVGLVMAGVPAVPWAALCLVVAAAECLGGGDTELAAFDLRGFGLLVGGGLLAGVLMGLGLAGGLALASRVLRGTGGLTLVGALLGGLVFPAEFVVVGVASDGGYAEFGTTFLLWPVMTAVAGAHGADIVGRTRRRGWLWKPLRGRGPSEG